MDLESLLCPARLDQLDLVGIGTRARVYRSGRFAVKVAHPDPRARSALREELAVYAQLSLPQLTLPTLYAADAQRGILVRDYLPGPSLFATLTAGKALAPQHLEQLWQAHLAIRRFHQEHGIQLDFSPANLFLVPDTEQIWLLDLGPRHAPAAIGDVAREDFPAAFCAATRWQQQLTRPDRLKPFLLPPGGRFHVEVSLGPLPGTRLRWCNDDLLRRLGLPWNRARLQRLAGVATTSPSPRVTHLASRYQDSPPDVDGGAQGDGRTVYLGTIGGGRYARRELMLKGCGPTSLQWQGHTYHHDGWVSFQRTLWETSICDELHRLGVTTPEVLAICSLPETTIDNTDRPWPVATAIRVSDTHYRLGHLERWAHVPNALIPLARDIGRAILRPDFEPTQVDHLEQLGVQFAAQLGFDVGFTDGLNIHGFNPTAGNLLCDGHLIDFSSVRVHRYCMPTYRILDGKRRAKEYRSAMRRQVANYVRVFVTAGLLTGERGEQLIDHARQIYDRRFDQGYLKALGKFVGFSTVAVGPRLARRLVDETIRFRALRAEKQIEFPFFKQSHPAPLFDLEGRCPDLVTAWRTGRRRPWMMLRASFPGELTPFGQHVAHSWWQLICRAIPRAERGSLEPRTFAEVIRPFMEINCLAELCYDQSTPEQLDRWQRRIATSRYLSPGRYSYVEAHTAAAAAGHVALAGLSPRRYEYVVGVTPELRAAIEQLLRDIIGPTLLGAIALGPRVMTPGRLRQITSNWSDARAARSDCLRETGWDPLRGTPLSLLVIVETSAPPRASRDWARQCHDRWAELSAPFPLAPRAPRIVGCPARTLSEALPDLRSGEKLIRNHWEAAVLFSDVRRGLKADPVGEVMAFLNNQPVGDEWVEVADITLAEETRHERPILSPHQIEMCLRDNDQTRPPPLRVKKTRRGLLLVHGRDILLSVRRAERTSTPVVYEPS